MAVNQVVINGETVVDLTDATAEADKVLDGEVFYTASGSRAVGNYVDKDTYTSAMCETEGSVAAKVAQCTNFVLKNPCYLHIVFKNANTVQSRLTLNVNGTGAYPIIINGYVTSASHYNIPAGSYLLLFSTTASNVTGWSLRTDNYLPVNISGTATYVGAAQSTSDSDRHVWFSEASTETRRGYDDDFKYNPSTKNLTIGTINGYSVEKDVPSNAVFTDTTDLASMTGTLPINKGGTNATTAADAVTNLGLGFVLLSATSASTTIAANAMAVVNFSFTVPTGYTIVSAFDNSYFANVVGSPIRINTGDGTVTVTFNYFATVGMTHQFQAKAFAVKL